MYKYIYSLSLEFWHTWTFSSLKLDMSAKDAKRYPQLKEDNGEAVTLFPPDCHDEILQTDVPIAPKPSDEPLILTGESLISSPCGKHLLCPKIHLSVTKWTQIFPFEEKLLTDLLLTVEIKHVEKSENYYKYYSPLELLFPLGMNFHFTLFFITRIGWVVQ